LTKKMLETANIKFIQMQISNHTDWHRKELLLRSIKWQYVDIICSITYTAVSSSRNWRHSVTPCRLTGSLPVERIFEPRVLTVFGRWLLVVSVLVLLLLSSLAAADTTALVLTAWSTDNIRWFSFALMWSGESQSVFTREGSVSSDSSTTLALSFAVDDDVFFDHDSLLEDDLWWFCVFSVRLEGLSATYQFHSQLLYYTADSCSFTTTIMIYAELSLAESGSHARQQKHVLCCCFLLLTLTVNSADSEFWLADVHMAYNHKMTAWT